MIRPPVQSINYKYLIVIVFLLTFSVSINAQKKLPEDFCVSHMEMNLFEMINQLRADYGKPKLQFSASLSYVAELHVADLLTNNPDTSICNLSSWSDKGDWTPCCYNSYVHNPDCMWDKPKELTSFTYRGYELVTFFEKGFNSDSIINLWSDSKEVLDMILTRGNYQNKKWICAGVGINDNYVSLWFAQRKDKLKKPEVCKEGNDEETTTSATATNKTNTYYLVFGSFNNLHDAREARNKIKDDGIKTSDIFTKNNKYRVYLSKYSSLKEAMFAKQQLPFQYREAWILKD